VKVNKIKKKKRKTTTERSVEKTTPNKGANDKHGDEDIDYEYTDGDQDIASDGASSRFKQFNMGCATLLSVLLYTSHKITIYHMKWL